MDADSDPLFWLREHGPRLLAFARQCAGRRADAEDVLQEAFLRFWQRRETAREPLLYLYRCIRNVAVDGARARGRRECRERDAARSPAASTMPHSLEQSELDGKIQEAVARLSAQHREVVALRIWSDMTFEQIAKVLSIPRSTAHALYGAAMRTLQSELEDLAER